MIKVMMWNILYGFRTMDKGIFQPERLYLARQAVKAVDPDILVLVEACWGVSEFPNVPPPTDYSKLFSFPHLSVVTRDHEWGYALYSRYPHRALGLPVSSKYKALKGAVETPVGILYLDSYHPYPYDPEVIKEVEFAEVIKGRHTPYMLIGDFNTISDVDPNPFGQLSSVIPMLKQAGLRDAFGDDRTTTYPTRLVQVDKHNPDCRIDHCFTEGLRILNTEVLKTEHTHMASDHYPLVVEVEFSS